MAPNRSPESFDQINSIHTRPIIQSLLVEGHLMMLHAKYESSSPYGLRQEDFLRFPSLALCGIQDQQHRANFHTRAII